MKEWTTRASGVPRGLLRFLVVTMLQNNPMSGAEIVREIEKETSGRWKPSPGSIYPLLAKLHEKGYIEQPSEGAGTKRRYALTPKGQKFFEKQLVSGQKLMDKLEFIVPLLIGEIQLHPNDQKITSKPGRPAKRVVTSLLDLRPVKVHLTEEDAQQLEKILTKCADELEVIVKKVQKKKS